ncbi:MAG: FecR family protein [Arenicella sp.]|nr:FecR family protein [Arenicella sp.]
MLISGFRILVVFACLASVNANAQEAGTGLTVIGEVALTKGVVTARSVSRPLTALAKGSPIYLKDIVETASRSFTVIKFNDGGKVTLRPETRFDLNEYDQTAGQEKQSFELLKGGLRAVTGAIGKAKPEQVTYAARNTTIGIRGTTLVIKLCEEQTEGCTLSEGLNSQADLEGEQDSKQYVDIFIVDKSGGTRQRITRQELRALLLGVYVSVIEGAIRISTKDWYIDMQAGDKCVVESTDAEFGAGGGTDEVDCFLPGAGLEDVDIFLSAEAETISVFNLIDDMELEAENELCEIN